MMEASSSCIQTAIKISDDFGISYPKKLTVKISDSTLLSDLDSLIRNHPHFSDLTCFILEHEGERLTDLDKFFMNNSDRDIHDSKDVVAAISLVPDRYDYGKVVEHFARFAEVTKLRNRSNAPSFLSFVETSDEDMANEHADFLSTQGIVMSKMIFEHQPMSFFRKLKLSELNPPSSFRKLCGDIFYIEMVPLEGEGEETFHFTASPLGFYLTKFEEGGKIVSYESEYFPTLAGIMSYVSPIFRERFYFSCLKQSNDYLELLDVSSPLSANFWAADVREDENENEKKKNNSGGFGLDVIWEMFRCKERDWNEELQLCREMDDHSSEDRCKKVGLLNSFAKDFRNAAVDAARSVMNGSLTPVSPDKFVRNCVFQDNNISLYFADYSGSSKKNENNILAGMRMLNAFSGCGLFSVGQTLIKIAGERLVCQSIVPGVMSLRYGFNEDVKSFRTHPVFSDAFESVFKELQLIEHEILDLEGTTHVVYGAAEIKGVIGEDNRGYLLDPVRMTPRDMNFVGDSCEDLLLRRECIRLFSNVVGFIKNPFDEMTMRLSGLLKHAQEDLLTQESESESESQSLSESCFELALKKSMGLLQTIYSPLLALNELVGGNLISVLDSCSGAFFADADMDQLSSLRCGFNVNVGKKDARFSLGQTEAVDSLLLDQVSNFLAVELIPKAAADIESMENFPLDGIALRSFLHARGINIRYLGTIIHYVSNPVAKQFLCREMIIRVAKHIWETNIVDPNNLSLEGRILAIYKFLNDIFPFDCSLPKPDLWDLVSHFVGEKFQYSVEEDEYIVLLKTHRIQLIRGFCLQTGLQIRDLCVFGQRDVIPTDIVNFLPVIKDSFSFCLDDVVDLFEVAFRLLVSTADVFPVELKSVSKSFSDNSRNRYDIVLFLIDEGLELCHVSLGPLDPMTGYGYSLLAWTLFRLDKYEKAFETQRKSVIIYERSLGRDHYRTVRAYGQLALYSLFSSNHSKTTSNFARHSCHLASLCGTKSHPEFLIDSLIIALSFRSEHPKRAISILENLIIQSVEVLGGSSVLEITIIRILSFLYRDIGLESEADAMNKHFLEEARNLEILSSLLVDSTSNNVVLVVNTEKTVDKNTNIKIEEQRHEQKPKPELEQEQNKSEIFRDSISYFPIVPDYEYMISQNLLINNPIVDSARELSNLVNISEEAIGDSRVDRVDISSTVSSSVTYREEPAFYYYSPLVVEYEERIAQIGVVERDAEKTKDTSVDYKMNDKSLEKQRQEQKTNKEEEKRIDLGIAIAEEVKVKSDNISSTISSSIAYGDEPACSYYSPLVPEYEERISRIVTEKNMVSDNNLKKSALIGSLQTDVNFPEKIVEDQQKDSKKAEDRKEVPQEKFEAPQEKIEVSQEKKEAPQEKKSAAPSSRKRRNRIRKKKGGRRK